MTSRQRDEWWLDQVFQRDAAQLTPRALLVGFLLGGLFALTNLYVSAKAGVTFGMGLTASILAFALFRVSSNANHTRPLHVLENNLIQTVAGAGGYMASAFTASLLALMVVQDQMIPWWQAMFWCAALSTLGLVVAIPLKRRFVNDTTYPFPEGQASAVVLSTLHQAPLATSESATGPATSHTSPKKQLDAPWNSTSARLLLLSALSACIVKLLQSLSILRPLHLSRLYVPEFVDEWSVRLVGNLQWPTLQLAAFRCVNLPFVRHSI